MIPINFYDDAINFFASCPPVYTLPGTWTKCNAIIPHYNADPNLTFAISFVVIVLGLTTFGVYKAFFDNKTLEDPWDHDD
tara:strand:+ start:367 stop:606 length:240 start_codon:yes stop_codon:yes gene_type:complete